MAGLSLSLFHSLFSYGLTSPRPTSLTFLVLACNAYKLRNIGDFLDVAWGVVDASSVRSQEDLDTLKVDLKQDVDFQNEMFAGGRRRQVCVEPFHVTISTSLAVPKWDYLASWGHRGQTDSAQGIHSEPSDWRQGWTAYTINL